MEKFDVNIEGIYVGEDLICLEFAAAEELRDPCQVSGLNGIGSCALVL
jgi:hypothetical protein